MNPTTQKCEHSYLIYMVLRDLCISTDKLTEEELCLQACEDREELDVDNDDAKGHQLVVELVAFKQRH